MQIYPVTKGFARQFLEAYHPLRCGGCLRGAKYRLAADDNGLPAFLAIVVTPRARWTHYPVTLELSRVAWSPTAVRSAATFLRACLRHLKQQEEQGLLVTYALPGTSGILYARAGFHHQGYSSGAPWSHRGPNERATPNTIGTGKRLTRYFADLIPSKGA